MTIEQDFSTLGLAVGSDLPSLTDVRKQYLKLSRAVHSDKHPNPEEKKAWDSKFVQLYEAYNRVQAYITANTPTKDHATDEEMYLRRYFEQHNDIRINIGQCTVILQDGTEQNWSDTLTKHYGDRTRTSSR